MSISETRREAIKKQWRLLRFNADKTQLQVETLARLDAGRYWKIENCYVLPTPAERLRIARVLSVAVQELPCEPLIQAEAQAEMKAS